MEQHPTPPGGAPVGRYWPPQRQVHRNADRRRRPALLVLHAAWHGHHGTARRHDGAAQAAGRQAEDTVTRPRQPAAAVLDAALQNHASAVGACRSKGDGALLYIVLLYHDDCT